MSYPWASEKNKLVLRENDIFVVSDEAGNMAQGQKLGLYYHDTRYLSVYHLMLNGQVPILLASSCELNFMASMQFTNLPIPQSGEPDIRRSTISLRCNRVVENGMLERIEITNYDRSPVTVQLTLVLGADFRDMLDVRGVPDAKRGALNAPEWNGDLLTFSYTGLDNQDRYTRITFDMPPTSIRLESPENMAVGQLAHFTWEVLLPHNQPWAVTLLIAPDGPAAPPLRVPNLDDTVHHLYQEYAEWGTRWDVLTNDPMGDYQEYSDPQTRWVVQTDNPLFDRLLQRSLADLRMLSQPEQGGWLLVAGLPWFAAPFGRDALIAALQTLSCKPEIAVGTLHALAQHQGQKEDRRCDEQPGKILHELRCGEMTALGQVPFDPSYQSIDATPLFLLLAAETMRWLGDQRLFDQLEPHIHAALDWIDQYGDVDHDGYVEYHTGAGVIGDLRHKSWRDYDNALQWPDGEYPAGPIAPAEVQGYVYAAKQGLSAVFARRGNTALAERLAREAADLKSRFNRDFWVDEKAFFAQALDGDKRPIVTVTSNPGHCLYTGLVDAKHHRLVVKRLLGDDMKSGWGIRTTSTLERSFNPMSYHNGSIWPHDNGIIAAGLMRYGYSVEALQLMTEIIAAATQFRYQRLPEFYYGFERNRRYYTSLVEHPASCSPQAWSAGTLIHLLQAMLGLEPDATRGQLRLRPHFPIGLNRVQIRNLRVGEATLDLLFSRPDFRAPITVEIVRNPGNIAVIIL